MDHKDRLQQMGLMDTAIARLEGQKAKIPEGRHREQLQKAIHHLRSSRRALQFSIPKKQG